jgi:hypothetical protein
MARFDRQIATALRLIQKNGQAITWRSLTNDPDPAEPWNAANTVVEHSGIFICFVPVRDRETRKLFQYLTGMEVQVGQLAGLMGNVNFNPTAKDIVIRDGVELRISNLDLLSPNGQKILWTLEFQG